MSQENVKVVRSPLRVRERSNRTLDQRLAIRFPRLAAANARMLSRLSPSSRLRRAVLTRSVQLASEAYNRRDLDAVVSGYHPAIEYYPARDWVEAGFFEPCYRGPDGYRAYVATTAEVFGDDVHFKPTELIDLGERIVMLATAPMRAQASGVRLTEEFAYVATQRDGQIISLQEYYDHSKALEAVGLRE
jgi:ketosteroid isomerase-like protein